MEFRDLKYFVKLVELKNYKKTADALKITQPAVSSMVKRLEHELAVPLIFQTSKRSQLQVTPAGKVVYKRAKQLIETEKEIIVEARRANQNNFRLGYSELAGGAWLASVITKLNQGHLLANVETHEENSHVLEQHLKDGKYDAIVFSRLSEEIFPGIETTTLEKFEYCLIVPEQSALAKRESVSIFDIQDTPLIMRHKRFLSRTALEHVFARTGFSPKKKLYVDSIEATAQLISNQMGVGYLMDAAVEHLPGVKAVPLIAGQKEFCYSTLGIRHEFEPNEIQRKCLNILSGI